MGTYWGSDEGIARREKQSRDACLAEYIKNETETERAERSQNISDGASRRSTFVDVVIT